MTEAAITEEDIFQGTNMEVLGPAYFASRRAVQRFMEHFEAEHFKPLTDKIVKQATDQIRETLWDDVATFFLSDAESNLQSNMWRQVDDCVQALLGGKEWALKRYALQGRYDDKAIREAVAKHIPKELQDMRVADLEAEVVRLKSDIEFYRRSR
jgi:hypothetical protein